MNIGGKSFKRRVFIITDMILRAGFVFDMDFTSMNLSENNSHFYYLENFNCVNS